MFAGCVIVLCVGKEKTNLIETVDSG